MTFSDLSLAFILLQNTITSKDIQMPRLEIISKDEIGIMYNLIKSLPYIKYNKFYEIYMTRDFLVSYSKHLGQIYS